MKCLLITRRIFPLANMYQVILLTTSVLILILSVHHCCIYWWQYIPSLSLCFIRIKKAILFSFLAYYVAACSIFSILSSFFVLVGIVVYSIPDKVLPVYNHHLEISWLWHLGFTFTISWLHHNGYSKTPEHLYLAVYHMVLASLLFWVPSWSTI